MQSYEKTLASILGECGKSQILLVLCVFPTGIFLSWTMTIMGFAGAQPKWWSVSQHFNSTTNTSYSILKEKVCPTVNETVVFDTSIFTIVSEWNLICDKDWIPAFITTMQMVGVLVGNAVGGHLGDWIGRKKSYIILYGTMMGSVLIQGFSVNWYMMSVFAFMMGFGIGGTLVVKPVFVMEFINTQWRTIVGLVPDWGVGLIIFGGMFKLLPNWRHLCIATCLLGSVSFIPVLFLPESIRWLLIKERTEEAKETLRKLAKRNKRSSQNDSAHEELKMHIRNEASKKSSQNYWTLLRLKETRYKALMFAFIWVYCSFSYYGLTLGVSRLDGDVSVNMALMGVADAFTNVFVWFISKFLKRRNSTTFLFVATCATAFTIPIAYAADASNYGRIKNGFAFTSRFFLAGAWMSVVIFTLESFPTEIRSVAYSFSNSMSRFGGIAAAQNDALSKIANHLPFTVSGSFALVSSILCLFLKDTYTEELPDYLGAETESQESLNKKDEGNEKNETHA